MEGVPADIAGHLEGNLEVFQELQTKFPFIIIYLEKNYHNWNNLIHK